MEWEGEEREGGKSLGLCAKACEERVADITTSLSGSMVALPALASLRLRATCERAKE